MSKKLNIISPVNDVLVTQGFGSNYLGFYKQWGLDGHPGIDYRLKHSGRVIASHKGIVTWAGKGKDGGIGIEIWDKNQSIKTFYYHHEKNLVKKNNIVEQGQLIAKGDNTGKYTTGSHEHFELYFVDKYGVTLNKDNGYKGSVNPALHLPKNWDKDNAYHRYGRKQNRKAEFLMRFKNPWLHRQLRKSNSIGKIYNTSFINALVYGSWAFSDVINPALYEIWGWCKKDEYTRGKKNFN